MILGCPKAGNRYNLSSSSPFPHFPTKYFPLTSPQSLQMPANLELSSNVNLTNEPQASGCSSVWPLKYWTTASPELLETVTMWNVRPCFLWQWKSVSAEWRTSVLWALSRHVSAEPCVTYLTHGERASNLTFDTRSQPPKKSEPEWSGNIYVTRIIYIWIMVTWPSGVQFGL